MCQHQQSLKQQEAACPFLMLSRHPQNKLTSQVLFCFYKQKGRGGESCMLLLLLTETITERVRVDFLSHNKGCGSRKPQGDIESLISTWPLAFHSWVQNGCQSSKPSPPLLHLPFLLLPLHEMQGMKPKALCMLDRHTIIEPHITLHPTAALYYLLQIQNIKEKQI